MHRQASNKERIAQDGTKGRLTKKGMSHLRAKPSVLVLKVKATNKPRPFRMYARKHAPLSQSAMVFTQPGPFLSISLSQIYFFPIRLDKFHNILAPTV